jgi:hypothetical protein
VDTPDFWKMMWERQRLQQEELALNPDLMTDEERLARAKEFQLNLVEETTKLGRVAVQYKPHFLKKEPINRANLAEAVVDVMKLAMTIAQLHGLSDREVVEEFFAKSDVIRDRALGERLELEKHTKVFATDLDGCVADLEDLDRALRNARGEAALDDAMIRALERLKEKFYKADGFRRIPPIHGAPEGLAAIKDAGFKVVIVTARPQWQYKRIYADTQAWLKDNKVAHDRLLFNKDKADAIVEHIFPAKPSWFVEDRSKHALELAAIGVKVLLFDNDGNRDLPPNPLIRRVHSWDEIVGIALAGNAAAA